MSNEQLMTAYLRGDLGRRQLVRRLTAGGVTLAAALAYAGMVPAVAHADQGSRAGGIAKACSVIPTTTFGHTELCGG